MNFYNPFKPHIVENGNGTYSVRKLTFPFLFKLYLHKNAVIHREEKITGFYWWFGDRFANKYCKYTKEEVLQVLEDYQAKVKEIKNSKPVRQVPIKDLIK